MIFLRNDNVQQFYGMGVGQYEAGSRIFRFLKYNETCNERPPHRTPASGLI